MKSHFSLDKLQLQKDRVICGCVLKQSQIDTAQIPSVPIVENTIFSRMFYLKNSEKSGEFVNMLFGHDFAQSQLV